MATDNVELLKQRLCSKYVFLVAGGCEYFNILIGDTSAPGETYHLHCSVVEKINQHVVASKIDDVPKKLNIERNNFVPPLSHAARYMTFRNALLKILYPQLFHITCLAHLLHNCAEKVRSHFPEVDNLIATVKAVTVKNKQRNHQFNVIGNLPQPVLTCWRTWLNAAECYAKNLEGARDIVTSFEGNGILVKRAKSAVNGLRVKEVLIKIQPDCQLLP